MGTFSSSFCKTSLVAQWKTIWKWPYSIFLTIQTVQSYLVIHNAWKHSVFYYKKNFIHELVYICRGLLSRSILQAQGASPIFTHVYAALVAIINSKFPNIGELILKRLILNFRKGYRRNDKVCKKCEETTC